MSFLTVEDVNSVIMNNYYTPFWQSINIDIGSDADFTNVKFDFLNVSRTYVNGKYKFTLTCNNYLFMGYYYIIDGNGDRVTSIEDYNSFTSDTPNVIYNCYMNMIEKSVRYNDINWFINDLRVIGFKGNHSIVLPLTAIGDYVINGETFTIRLRSDDAIIDTFEAVEETYPVIIEEEAEEEEEDHDHGTDSEEHHHDSGTNSHIWMSEEIYAGQVQAIAEGLTAIDSSHAKLYASNADTFIDVMDSQIDTQGVDEALSGTNVAVLHEAFAYTAQSLGANVVATMDLDEERQVSAGEVSSFIDTIKENDVKIVLAEYDYGHAMGELITEQTEAKVVYLETLVHGDYSGLDYITVLNKNYAVIKNSL